MKYTIFLLLSLLLFTLAACGGKKDEPPEETGTTTAETTVPVTSAPATTAAETTAKPEPKYTYKEGKYTMHELTFKRDGLKIYGQLYLPEGTGKFPVIVICHGLGGTYKWELDVAKGFARFGVAAYCFDFIGGGPECMSDGTMKDMTVLTEAADLEAVLDGITKRDDIDPDNVFLWGESQGGLIETIVAARRPEQIKAMIALFPGYVIGDFCQKYLDGDPEFVKAVESNAIPVGEQYMKDAVSFDIYEMIPKITCPVTIFHGAGDPVVPLEYSERALPLFPDADLVVYDDVKEHSLGNHYAEMFAQAVKFIRNNIK